MKLSNWIGISPDCYCPPRRAPAKMSFVRCVGHYYRLRMCGRVFVKSSFAELMAAFADVRRGDNLASLEKGPRHNGAPSLIYPIIVRVAQSARGAFTEARWGLVPSWGKEEKPKVQPANARGESIKTNGMFRGAYRSQRCLVPVDGYFEWKEGHQGREARLTRLLWLTKGHSVSQASGTHAPILRHGQALRQRHSRSLRASRTTSYRGDPRPNACDPPREGLRALAQRGSGSRRPHGAIPQSTHEELACKYARQQRAQPRRRPARSCRARGTKPPVTSDKKSNQKIEGAIVIPDGTPIIINLEHENENEMVRVEFSLGVRLCVRGCQSRISRRSCETEFVVRDIALARPALRDLTEASWFRFECKARARCKALPLPYRPLKFQV